jgi:hypothetical protein
MPKPPHFWEANAASPEITSLRICVLYMIILTQEPLAHRGPQGVWVWAMSKVFLHPQHSFPLTCLGFGCVIRRTFMATTWVLGPFLGKQAGSSVVWAWVHSKGLMSSIEGGRWMGKPQRPMPQLSSSSSAIKELNMLKRSITIKIGTQHTHTA